MNSRPGGCSTASSYAIGLPEHCRRVSVPDRPDPVSGRLGSAGQDAATLRESSASGETPSARPAKTP